MLSIRWVAKRKELGFKLRMPLNCRNEFMCYHFQTPNMLIWLRHQVRVLEAWREDVATRPDLDLEMIMRLEQHYQWLTAEIGNLERLDASKASEQQYDQKRHQPGYANRSFG
jgi:hypothetical protein